MGQQHKVLANSKDMRCNKDMTQQEKQKEQEQREKAIEYHQQQKFERFLNTGSYY